MVITALDGWQKVASVKTEVTYKVSFVIKKPGEVNISMFIFDK